MNIGLIYSVEGYLTVDHPLSSLMEIHFGLSFISSVLKQAGHCTELIVLTQDTNVEEVLSEYIKRAKPAMFGMTAVTTQIPIMEKAASYIKKYDPSIYVVLGGAHATLVPEDAIRLSFDAVCVGEGEKTIVELAEMVAARKKITGIPNLWIKTSGNGVEKNPTRPFNAYISDLPFPDREMWMRWIAPGTAIHSTMLLLGRGCPYKCTYCSNHVISQVANGAYVRFREPQGVFDEILSISKQWPDIRHIYFEVETFGANIKYALQFCNTLSEFNATINGSISYGINLAVTKKLGEGAELLEGMKKANIKYVNVGLESGSERVRTEILRRPKYSNTDLVHFSEKARSFGVNVHLYVLLGIPGETVADFMETVKCTRECQPSNCMVSIFFPYPGTDLHRMAGKMGLIEGGKIDGSAERTRAIFATRDFPKWRIRLEYTLFYYRVYHGRWPASKVLATVLRSFIAGYPVIYHLWRGFSNNTALGRFLKRTLKPGFSGY